MRCLVSFGFADDDVPGHCCGNPAVCLVFLIVVAHTATEEGAVGVDKAECFSFRRKDLGRSVVGRVDVEGVDDRVGFEVRHACLRWGSIIGRLE